MSSSSKEGVTRSSRTAIQDTDPTSQPDITFSSQFFLFHSKLIFLS